MKLRLCIFLVVLMAAFSAFQTQPLVAQSDLCSLPAVLSAYESAALSGDVQTWLQRYEDGACSLRITAAARHLAAGYRLMANDGQEIIFDNAMDFDGENDYIQLAGAEAFGVIDSDLTVEAWIKVRAFSRVDLSILGQGIGLEANKRLSFIVRRSKILMSFYGTALTSVQSISENTWYHVAWRYTKTNGEMTIFINGELDNAGTGYAPFAGTSPLMIGSWGDTNNGMTFFNGQIIDLRIWNVARTPEEIQSNMYIQLTGQGDGLIAYYPLDAVFNGAVPELVSGLNGAVNR